MSADIDIDFKDRTAALGALPHILATMQNMGEYVKHNTGVYFQDIPVNPMTGLASIPYKQADDLGYFKIDFLNNTIYSNVRDESHLLELIDREPPWFMLGESEFVEMLAHVHSHFDVVESIKPQSVEDLAVVLALIRPGKRHLVGRPRHEIDAEIWTKPTDGTYHFKKSHSVAYAVSIVVQMNLLVEG